MGDGNVDNPTVGDVAHGIGAHALDHQHSEDHIIAGPDVEADALVFLHGTVDGLAEVVLGIVADGCGIQGDIGGVAVVDAGDGIQVEGDILAVVHNDLAEDVDFFSAADMHIGVGAGGHVHGAGVDAGQALVRQLDGLNAGAGQGDVGKNIGHGGDGIVGGVVIIDGDIHLLGNGDGVVGTVPDTAHTVVLVPGAIDGDLVLVIGGGDILEGVDEQTQLGVVGHLVGGGIPAGAGEGAGDEDGQVGVGPARGHLGGHEAVSVDPQLVLELQGAGGEIAGLVACVVVEDEAEAGGIGSLDGHIVPAGVVGVGIDGGAGPCTQQISTRGIPGVAMDGVGPVTGLLEVDQHGVQGLLGGDLVAHDPQLGISGDLAGGEIGGLAGAVIEDEIEGTLGIDGQVIPAVAVGIGDALAGPGVVVGVALQGTGGGPHVQVDGGPGIGLHEVQLHGVALNRLGGLLGIGGIRGLGLGGHGDHRDGIGGAVLGGILEAGQVQGQGDVGSFLDGELDVLAVVDGLGIAACVSGAVAAPVVVPGVVGGEFDLIGARGHILIGDGIDAAVGTHVVDGGGNIPGLAMEEIALARADGGDGADLQSGDGGHILALGLDGLGGMVEGDGHVTGAGDLEGVVLTILAPGVVPGAVGDLELVNAGLDIGVDLLEEGAVPLHLVSGVRGVPLAAAEGGDTGNIIGTGGCGIGFGLRLGLHGIRGRLTGGNGGPGAAATVPGALLDGVAVAAVGGDLQVGGLVPLVGPVVGGGGGIHPAEDDVVISCGDGSLVHAVAIAVGHVGPGVGAGGIPVVDGEAGVTLLPVGVGHQIELGALGGTDLEAGQHAQHHDQSQQQAECFLDNRTIFLHHDPSFPCAPEGRICSSPL